MSQLNDITREFLKMKNKYNWNRMETVENMHNVLSACEWQLFSDDEIPKNAAGCDDLIKKWSMEKEEIYRLLFNHIVEPDKYFMEAREFYDKRINEEPTIGSVQLMEEFAKHIIEINFCDGSSIDFEKLSVDQLKKIHNNVNKCVDWVNS